MQKILRNAGIKVRNHLPVRFHHYISKIGYIISVDSSRKQWWDNRLEDVCASSDNQHINRHPEAGMIKNGILTMHNGLKVWAGSYYGWGSLRILIKNKAVHEPQEERVFQEVLKAITPGSTMVELGSFWAFYSAWFANDIPNGRCIMVEPDKNNLENGRANFQLNDLSGKFINASLGATEEYDEDLKCNRISIDALLRREKIDKLAILHSDIQGFEGQMLDGASKALKARQIDFVFISTHSNEIHLECVQKLVAHEYKICHSIDLDQTFSQDGLIVAVAPGVDWSPIPDLSSKNDPL